jgi:hypothetical protein
MSGNTKLVGFLPGDALQLERWGEKVAVGVTKESMINIRNACQSLPKSPPEQHDYNGFNVQYDKSVGRVLVDMDPSTAEALAKRVEAAAITLHLLSHEEVQKAESWVHRLRAVVKAHEDYHGTEGEPGVEDTH